MGFTDSRIAAGGVLVGVIVDRRRRQGRAAPTVRGGARAGCTPGVGIDVIGEDGQRAANHAGHTVGVTARTSAHHRCAPGLEPRPPPAVSASRRQLFEVARHGGEAEDARTALSGALPGHEARHVRRLRDAAHVSGKDGHHAGADGSTCRRERCRRVGHAQGVGGDPAPAVAPGEDGGHLVDGSGLSDDDVQRCAEVVLVDAGAVHRARHRHQRGTGRVRPSARVERVGPVAGDERHVRHGLHVVHERRAVVELEGDALVRTPRRRAGAAAQPRHQRRFLTRHVPAGHAQHLDGIGRCLVALGERATHRQRHVAPPGGHAHHDPRRVHDPRRQLGSVEHQVRRTCHEHVVLAAGRLALHGVDDHRRPSRHRPDVRQLARRGERRPPRPVNPASSTARPKRAAHEASGRAGMGSGPWCDRSAARSPRPDAFHTDSSVQCAGSPAKATLCSGSRARDGRPSSLRWAQSDPFPFELFRLKPLSVGSVFKKRVGQSASVRTRAAGGEALGGHAR